MSLWVHGLVTGLAADPGNKPRMWVYTAGKDRVLDCPGRKTFYVNGATVSEDYSQREKGDTVIAFVLEQEAGGVLWTQDRDRALQRRGIARLQWVRAQIERTYARITAREPIKRASVIYYVNLNNGELATHFISTMRTVALADNFELTEWMLSSDGLHMELPVSEHPGGPKKLYSWSIEGDDIGNQFWTTYLAYAKQRIEEVNREHEEDALEGEGLKKGV